MAIMLINNVVLDDFKQKMANINFAEYKSADIVASNSSYSVADGVAYIDISGMLVPKDDKMLDYFGIDYTSYESIQNQTIMADSDPAIKEIVYNVNTGGGYVDGVDYTAEIIKNTTKPTTATIFGMSASAGYYLSSQADKVEAVTIGSMIGSIGVAVNVTDFSSFYEQNGIKEYDLTNDDSTDKRPNISEDAGRRVIVDELNDIYAVFEERVITARGISADAIKSLNGRTVTARKALELGLIDNIKSLGVTQMNKQEETTVELSTVVEESVIADAKAEERNRIMGLLDIAGVSLSDEVKESIEANETDKDLAVKLIKNGAVAQEKKAVVATVELPAVDGGNLEDDFVDNDKLAEEKLDKIIAKTLGKRVK